MNLAKMQLNDTEEVSALSNSSFSPSQYIYIGRDVTSLGQRTTSKCIVFKIVWSLVILYSENRTLAVK